MTPTTEAAEVTTTSAKATMTPTTAEEKIENAIKKNIQLIFIDFHGKHYRSFDLKEI